MRGGVPRTASLAGVAGIALAALGVGAGAPTGRIYGYDNIKRHLQRHGRSRRAGSFDPRYNRNTGAPHEHRREIARRTTAPGTPERRAAMAAARGPA